MAHLLVALSMAAGLAIGLWLVVAIPSPAYPYLVVAFLVFLDGLLFSLYRLQRGRRMWMLLTQRLALHSAYAFFILFYGVKAHRDLLMLATIPLGLSVFLNLLHLFQSDLDETSLVQSTLAELDGGVHLRAREQLPVTRVKEQPVTAETAAGPPASLPAPITTFTVSATTTSTPEPTPVEPAAPPAPKARVSSQGTPASPYEP